jgi:hypothetical protein
LLLALVASLLQFDHPTVLGKNKCMELLTALKEEKDIEQYTLM